jgi:hypothetical protein
MSNRLVKFVNKIIDAIMDRRLGDHPANYVRFHRYCPQCGNEMMPDVILEDGRGLRAANIRTPSFDEMQDGIGYREANGEPLTVHVAGEGSYCDSCKRGWTIGELYQMGMEKRNKPV